MSGGSRYTVLIMQASENLAINCYFSVYKDESIYSPIEVYTSKMRTFKKIGDYSFEYNCLAYAMGITNDNIDAEELGLPKSLDQFEEYLGDRGYTRVSSKTANCIIAYGPSESDIRHFAKVENNVVTAKIGSLELMEHVAYNAYYQYSNYGAPQGFFVK